MSDGTPPYRTIPEVLSGAAGRSPLITEADIARLAGLGVMDADELTHGWADARAAGAGDAVLPPPHTSVSHDDIAVIIPTSGTTGRSKLVTQTHRAYAMA